ncbi:ATP-binding protein [Glutamicibacter sp. JC586]|uniref:ATP-binding protein n=1 Tax=Glutamicibacter sp. JC586 TaxID=2590552 RepID=UPI00135A9B24|nr:GNAT family N-acetyltransferase [Glutamicibacter sp. JC586]
MHPWRIKDLQAQDLDSLIELWHASRDGHLHSVYSISDVLTAGVQGHSVGAFVGTELVGAAIARIQEDRAWILMLGQAPAWRNQGLGSCLLNALEETFSGTKVAKLCALLPASEDRFQAFHNSGFEPQEEVVYFEHSVPVPPQTTQTLLRLGGTLMPRGLWDEVAGMRAEKELIERRLILPLAQEELAKSLGVIPPRAVALFGPPGTGKTTFAKAVASRLGWPFIEVFPSRLAADPSGLAAALRQTFSEIAHLEHAVVFIDEVEEIAARRSETSPSPLQSVTNELLKTIPAFRAKEGRLLICATNFIRSLDHAFLRHGRFDYVIPIGLPDFAARQAIWARYIPESARDLVNLAILAQHTERFSPADIEFAARKASQCALEESVYGTAKNDAPELLHTANYLEAIAQTQATASEETINDFRADITALGRI